MQLCPLLIPPSCPVLLGFVGLLSLSDAEDLWTPPLPAASQEQSCSLSPSFVASERVRPSLCFHLKSRRNGQKRQVTVTFPSQGWTLCVLHKLVKDERMLAGEAKRELGGGRKEGSEGRAAKPTARQTLGISTLQSHNQQEEILMFLAIYVSKRWLI